MSRITNSGPVIIRSPNRILVADADSHGPVQVLGSQHVYLLAATNHQGGSVVMDRANGGAYMADNFGTMRITSSGSTIRPLMLDTVTNEARATRPPILLWRNHRNSHCRSPTVPSFAPPLNGISRTSQTSADSRPFSQAGGVLSAEYTTANISRATNRAGARIEPTSSECHFTDVANEGTIEATNVTSIFSNASNAVGGTITARNGAHTFLGHELANHGTVSVEGGRLDVEGGVSTGQISITGPPL